MKAQRTRSRAGRTARGLCIILVVFAAGSTRADTSIRSQATEGLREDNAIRIARGCEDDRPVIAQSVVFPTDSPELVTNDSNVSVQSLSEVIQLESLANLVQSIQDRSIFDHQNEIVDEFGNVTGLQARKGSLQADLVGRVPFQFSAPPFVGQSCLRRMIIEIAVADICSTKQPALSPRRVNLWIPDNGSRIAIEGATAGVEVIGDPARLIVNRSVDTNPLPSECGDGFDLTVTPSALQIDRDLPIRSYWNLRSP